MTMGAADGAGKTVLFILTEDFFFLSHFQPMARAVSALGCKVVVAARKGGAVPAIEALGYAFAPIDIGRSGLSPLEVARAVLALRGILARRRPDIVHAIALPPVVVAALATGFWGGRRPLILAPTGLGHLWIEKDRATAVAREGVRRLVALCGRRRNVRFLFENAEDPAEFGLDPGNARKVTVVGGAGVSPADFAAVPPPPAPPLRVAIVARMTAPKGIAPAVEAVRRLRAEGRDIHLDLYGAPDPRSRRSIPQATLDAWNGEAGLAWHGHTDDVRSVWAGAHVAALLSWREGLPRGVVEAMARGRPVVTTDVPGCRTLIRDGIEGLLVPPEDVDATAAALRTLYDDPDRRLAMGLAARQRFEAGFTEAAVERTTTTLYGDILAGLRRGSR